MMQTNSYHITNTKGSTTNPLTSLWWVGSSNYRIAFDYLLLEGECIAIHAIYGNAERKTHSEFFYGVAYFEDALACATNIISSAKSLIIAHDRDSITEADNIRSFEFIDALKNEITYGTR